MPITKYQYSIAMDTATGSVNLNTLQYEIAASIPGVAIDRIDANIEPDKCDVYMADTLTPGDQATLAAVIGAHQGVGYFAKLYGTLQIVPTELAIVSDAAWQTIAGVLTTPRFFYDDISYIRARIIGQHKGDGGQLRFFEDSESLGSQEKISPYHDFPDTLGSWERFKVDSNVPPQDDLRNVYTTEARLNGAASLELRYTTVSMILVLPV